MFFICFVRNLVLRIGIIQKEEYEYLDKVDKMSFLVVLSVISLEDMQINYFHTKTTVYTSFLCRL